MLHPLNLPRSVRDPIHGTIRLTTEEFAVMNHRLFRRLHRIRQNGLLYLIFPSATHTRFEHSLGVLYVADAMLRNLYFNSRVSSQKSIPGVLAIDAAAAGDAVDFSSVPDEVVKRIFGMTRLAALVHDLGHGPYSHTFDSFAPAVTEVQELLKTAPELHAIRQLAERIDPKAPDASGVARIQHEDMSCVLFAYIWDELSRPGMKLNEDVPAIVTAILRGRPEMCDDDSLRGFIPLMHDIIASAPADADRMDYLERDSRSIGVSYGLFDRNRLLSSILAYREGETHYRLGFKRSGLRAVENFIQARFELFVQVYYHKTNVALEQILSRIASAASAGPVLRFADLGELVQLYLELSDEYFLTVLLGKSDHLRIDNPEVTELAELIVERRLWKRIFEGDYDGAVEVAKAIEQKFGQGLATPARVEPKATKDLEAGAALLERSGSDGIYRARRDTSWIDASTIIGALAENEQKIGRVYLVVEDERSTAVKHFAREFATQHQLPLES
jgi:HD superfamily phosphohydrolase